LALKLNVKENLSKVIVILNVFIQKKELDVITLAKSLTDLIDRMTTLTKYTTNIPFTLKKKLALGQVVDPLTGR